MALFLLIVFLGGLLVVGMLVRSAGAGRPRAGAPGSEEYDVWGRPRGRRGPESAEKAEAVGAARLLS